MCTCMSYYSKAQANVVCYLLAFGLLLADLDNSFGDHEDHEKSASSRALSKRVPWP